MHRIVYLLKKFSYKIFGPDQEVSRELVVSFHVLVYFAVPSDKVFTFWVAVELSLLLVCVDTDLSPCTSLFSTINYYYKDFPYQNYSHLNQF